MKKFKTIDLYASILLIIVFTVYSIIKKEQSFITGYLVVGGWQLVSMIVHVWNRCFTYKPGSRNTYHWITLISLLAMPLGSYWILLFAAPCMAVYYTFLCYQEVYVKMQRPLAVLK